MLDTTGLGPRHKESVWVFGGADDPVEDGGPHVLVSGGSTPPAGSRAFPLLLADLDRSFPECYSGCATNPVGSTVSREREAGWWAGAAL